VAGLVTTFGSGAMTNSLDDIRQAKCILAIGTNTTEAHPIIGMDIRKAVRENGMKLIVANPLEIGLVSSADLWLKHCPGTDVVLLNNLEHGGPHLTCIGRQTENRHTDYGHNNFPRTQPEVFER